MRGLFWRALVLIIAAAASGGAAAPTRTLTFEDRVVAQEAIERVYYSHQIGTTKPFEEAVPREVLERKVRTYLEQSVALQEFWKAPITAAALWREVQRMEQGTRMAERLREIDDALGNDPFVTAETLGRVSLADRLARNYFSSDQRIQGVAHSEAEALRARLVSGELSIQADDPHRTVTAQSGVEEPTPYSPGAGAELSRTVTAHSAMSQEEFSRLRAAAPDVVGEIGQIREERNAFVVRVLLGDSPGSSRIATYAVMKQPWDTWWSRARAGFDSALLRPTADVPALGSAAVPEPQAAGSRLQATACVADDTWDNGVLDDVPEIRFGHSAVWTGSIMIIWGGYAGGSNLVSGSRYDPLTDTWKPTSTIGAPSPRAGHSAVWTGREMIVWGGSVDANLGSNTGARYDPSSDTWTPMTINGAPPSRAYHTAIWTGREMLVWGGLGGGFFSPIGTGGRYDPSTDSWESITTVDAPSPRYQHTAVWTGTEMIVWGGSDLNTGGRYNPAADTWTPTSESSTVLGRRLHSAVWTGVAMIIWGGVMSSQFGEVVGAQGARYDPATDSWTPMTTSGEPSVRDRHTAIWTGTEMIVWGGTTTISTSNFLGDPALGGGRYDPSTDTWTQVPDLNSPLPRYAHTAVWTGTHMLVWGGTGSYTGMVNTGGRFDPAAGTWTPTSASSGSPPALAINVPVWTGNEMILWAADGLYFYVNTLPEGGRYNPTTDSWSYPTTTNAPSPRTRHTAVWTGSEMIVWGGVVPRATAPSNDGGRYNPMTDSWVMISTKGAPTGRADPLAVWTGREMIVWGGSETTCGSDCGAGQVSTGGRYDPLDDTWTSMSSISAPPPAQTPTVVWTGSEMIVWGGRPSPFAPYALPGSGGRYDPRADTWRPTSTAGAPLERRNHTAVWTGSTMIVFGGYRSSGYSDLFNDGGQYDPVTDSWRLLVATDPTLRRRSHSAVWTGRRMIVWGGALPYATDETNLGSLYDPISDTWSSMSLLNAPIGRYRHAAIWAGDFMIIWGGQCYLGTTAAGGRYALGHTVDDDGDGYSECAGDCDDANPSVFPGAPQICGDHRNNDCNSLSWPSLAGTNEADDDGDSFTPCQGDCDDTSAAVHPGATEICDGIDNDCDGVVDNGNPGGGQPCGVSNLGQCRFGTTECSSGTLQCMGSIGPFPEVCNGLDDDCDGTVPPSELDADGDGFRGCQNDCNDSDPTINPLAVELPGNAIDENCDGVLSCDPAAFYKTHGQFVSCVSRACYPLVSSGLVPQAECDALISHAAQSNVGRRQRTRAHSGPAEP